MKPTRGEREVGNVSDCGDKNRCAFLEKPSGDRIRIRLLVRTLQQLDRILRISNSEAGVKEEKSGGVVGEAGECGDGH